MNNTSLLVFSCNSIYSLDNTLTNLKKNLPLQNQFCSVYMRLILAKKICHFYQSSIIILTKSEYYLDKYFQD